MDYDYIIVLSGAAKNLDGKFVNSEGGMYIGTESRIIAAAKLIEKYPSAEFIVVGGYNEKNVGIADTSKKVDDVVDSLKEKYSNAKIQEIYSLPCTHHNFVATFNYWKINKIAPRRVGIVTNAYHMPRALEFAKRCAADIIPDIDISFHPIPAEEIAEVQIEDNLMKRSDYRTRVTYEETGLAQIINGTYRDSCLTSVYPLIKDVVTEDPEHLLTKSEIQSLKSLEFQV